VLRFEGIGQFVSFTHLLKRFSIKMFRLQVAVTHFVGI
jgi:hypothetical protein